MNCSWNFTITFYPHTFTSLEHKVQLEHSLHIYQCVSPIQRKVLPTSSHFSINEKADLFVTFDKISMGGTTIFCQDTNNYVNAFSSPSFSMKLVGVFVLSFNIQKGILGNRTVVFVCAISDVIYASDQATTHSVFRFRRTQCAYI